MLELPDVHHQHHVMTVSLLFREQNKHQTMMNAATVNAQRSVTNRIDMSTGLHSFLCMKESEKIKDNRKIQKQQHLIEYERTAEKNLFIHIDSRKVATLRKRCFINPKKEKFIRHFLLK